MARDKDEADSSAPAEAKKRADAAANAFVFLLSPAVKNVVAALLAVLFLAQLIIAAGKLSDGLPSTTISYKSVQSLDLPGFLFCQAPISGFEFQTTKGSNNLTLEEETSTMLAEFATHPIVARASITEDIFENYEQNLVNLVSKDAVDAADWVDWSDVDWLVAFQSWTDDSSLGACQMFTPKMTIKPSPFAGVAFSLNIPTGQQVFVKVFESGQLVTAVDGYLGADTISVSKIDRHLYYEVSQTWIENLNHEEEEGGDECDEDNNTEFFSCSSAFMARYMGCNLPWLREGMDPNYKEGARTCDLPNDATRYKDLVANKLTRSDLAAVKELTGCVNNCRYTKYDITTFSQIDNADDSDPPTQEIVFKFMQTSVPEEKEERSYDASSFIADVGGYLGLLLGLSLLDVMEQAVRAVGRAVACASAGGRMRRSRRS